MRKCIRCGSEMKENCAIKVEGQDMALYFLPTRISYLEEEWGNRKSLYVQTVERFLSIWKT